MIEADPFRAPADPVRTLPGAGVAGAGTGHMAAALCVCNVGPDGYSPDRFPGDPDHG